MSDTRSPLETIEHLITCMREKDYEGASGLFHPDVVVEEPDSVPFYSGTHRGFEAVQNNMFGAMLGNYDLVVNEGTSARDAGDVVLGVLDLTFTSHKTGAKIRMNVIELYTVTDGLVSHIDVYYKDTTAMGRTFPEGLPASDPAHVGWAAD